MSRRYEPTTSPGEGAHVTDMIVDRFPAVLVQLHQTALRVLKVHIRGDTGACLLYGAHWPCERAMLAAWSLRSRR
jgi:hypothetical protein